MQSHRTMLLSVLGLLCLFSVKVTVAESFSWQETTFQTNGRPQTVSIAPHTIMYQCGFKSADKQKYNITSDLPLYAYTVDKSDLKDVKMKGDKLSFSAERRTACVNRTACKESSPGRIIKFEKCFVLNNALNGQQATAVLEFSNKWDDKVLVVFVFLGLVVLMLGVVCCCILSRAFHCMDSCDCCAGVWHYYGKAKRKGYSPYQVSAV